MSYIGNKPTQGSISGGDIVDESIETSDLKDAAVTTDKLHNNAVHTDKIADGAVTAAKIADGAAVPTQTGHAGKFLSTDGTTASWAEVDLTAFDAPVQLKNYTTAQRNALTGLESGDTIFNSSTGSIEFYDGTSWVATNLIPTVNSVTGSIYAGVETTLTLDISNATETVTVRFSEGGAVVADVTNVTVTSGSASVAVPAEVYGQTAGDTITVTTINEDGTPASNNISKTVIAVPSGGTVHTVNGYRVHTFTSTDNFVVPSGLTVTTDILLVAGGGGGGLNGGSGAGGGGLILRPNKSVTAGTYSFVVGQGGQGRKLSQGKGNGATGGDSTALGLTAKGGGFGEGLTPFEAGGNGGSGGGGGNGRGTGIQTSQSGDSGTYGYGNDGGRAESAGHTYGGGGGGAGQGGSAVDSGNGGDGLYQVTQSGTTYNFADMFGTTVGEIINGEAWFSGGGAANIRSIYGGKGGGGHGSSVGNSGETIPNCDPNTGGGGGGVNTGGSPEAGNAGDGGSGVIQIRYQLP